MAASAAMASHRRIVVTVLCAVVTVLCAVVMVPNRKHVVKRHGQVEVAVDAVDCCCGEDGADMLVL